LTRSGNTGFYRTALLLELEKAESRQHNIHQRNHENRSLDQGDGVLKLEPFNAKAEINKNRRPYTNKKAKEK